MAPPDSSEHDVISSAMLQALVDMIGADAPEQVVEFIDIYLDQAQQLIDRLHEAIDGRDSAALLIAVHSLKSGSALVGALDLSALCAEMERAARSGDTAFDNAASLDAIEAAHYRAHRALLQERQAFLAQSRVGQRDDAMNNI